MTILFPGFSTSLESTLLRWCASTSTCGQRWPTRGSESTSWVVTFIHLVPERDLEGEVRGRRVWERSPHHGELSSAVAIFSTTVGRRLSELHERVGQSSSPPSLAGNAQEHAHLPLHSICTG
uniref:Uncharacterized protein n=3 Tax=Aegilops tauschii subsp. strangulata TaxID=200361 RepID=A0A453BR53_AEGTS